MALKDRDRTRPRRLTRLGVIRLGHKVTQTRKRQDGTEYEISYPVQDDHFIFTDAPELEKQYGDTDCREIDVLLPFPDVPRNFDAFYQVWAGGTLICKGDGDCVQYAAPCRVEKKNNDRVSVYRGKGETLVSDGIARVAVDWNGERFDPGEIVICPGAAKGLYPHCAACKIGGILKVMIADPELFRFGYYQISTGSGRNYDNILGTLELISANGQRAVNGFPFKLRLMEEATTYIENGERHTTDKWFLKLEPDPGLTRKLYQLQAHNVFGAMLPEKQSVANALDIGEQEYIDGSQNAPPPYAEEGGPAEEPEIIQEKSPPQKPVRKRKGKAKRPLEPEQLKKFLLEKESQTPDTWWTTRATEPQYKLVARAFEECFAPDKKSKDKYHAALQWLWDNNSAKNLTISQASVTIDWLLIGGDGDDKYDLHRHASAEAEAVYKQALIDSGQAELDL